MRIFVAGATGVLGRRAVPALVEGGHEVTGVARDAAKGEWLADRGARPVAVSLFEAAAVARAVEGHDVVVNLATAVPPGNRMALRSAWDATNRLRTEASDNLVDAALAGGAARYVQESIGFGYAEHGSAWVDEDAPLHVPDHAAGVVAAEANARRFAAAGGDAVALRFGLFYSADSPHTRTLLAAARRGLLTMPGRPDGYQSWVHVDDAAAAVVAAVEAQDGTYNVVEDDPLTNAGHVAVLGDVLGRRVRHLPAWLGRWGPLALMARSQRVGNGRLREATSWRPRYGSRREGWTSVVAAVSA